MGLGLSSSLQINVALPERAPGDVELPISFYLPRPFLEAATRTSYEVHRQIDNVLRDSHIYQSPCSPDDLRDFLEKNIERRLTNDPASAFWLQATREAGVFRIGPRLQGIDLLTPKYQTLSLKFVISGLSATAEIPPPLLRGLVPRLLDWKRNGVPTEAPEDLRHVFKLLNENGAFIPEPENPVTVAPESLIRPIVTTLGHAFLVIDFKSKRVLVDPWLHENKKVYAHPTVSITDLGKIDAVFLTHHHPDHFHLDALLRLPAGTPIYVPKSGSHWSEPKYARLLSDLGFENVHELLPGDSVTISDDFTMHGLEFYGEGRNHIGFGALTYFAALTGHSFLIHADAGEDSAGASLLRDGTVRTLVEKYGPIERIFATWWQAKVLTYQLSAFAIFSENLPSRTWLTTNELCNCETAFLRALARAGRTQEIVFYAENGPENFLPLDKRSAYLSTISYYWHGAEEVSRDLAADGVRVRRSEPWDVF